AAAPPSTTPSAVATGMAAFEVEDLSPELVLEPEPVPVRDASLDEGPVVVAQASTEAAETRLE
ncbi:hypothetical protein PHISP_01905, partial [Aspergillus sp. HF37]